MSDQAFEFRSATFGGFNRDDVTNYIKKITEEHQLELQKLQLQLDDVTKQRDALAAASWQQDQAERQLSQVQDKSKVQVSALEGKIADLQAEIELQSEEIEHLTQERDALQTKTAGQIKQLTQERDNLQRKVTERASQEQTVVQSQAQAEIDRLTQERDALQAKLDAWAPSITTYDAIKSQMAEIELDARERSAALLRRAEMQAQAIRRQSEEKMAHSAALYDQTRADTNKTITYMVHELQRLQNDLQNLCGVMDCDAKNLFDLTQEEKPEND